MRRRALLGDLSIVYTVQPLSIHTPHSYTLSLTYTLFTPLSLIPPLSQHPVTSCVTSPLTGTNDQPKPCAFGANHRRQ